MSKQDSSKILVIESLKHRVIDPVTWCRRIVICPKRNGKMRRTVDFHPLKVHAARETHHTQLSFRQAHLVPHNKKTVFHYWNKYHSVPLHEDDHHLITLTFTTPWGHFSYKTAPLGYIASSEDSHINSMKLFLKLPARPKV